MLQQLRYTTSRLNHTHYSQWFLKGCWLVQPLCVRLQAMWHEARKDADSIWTQPAGWTSTIVSGSAPRFLPVKGKYDPVWPRRAEFGRLCANKDWFIDWHQPSKLDPPIQPDHPIKTPKLLKFKFRKRTWHYSLGRYLTFACYVG